MTKALRSVLLLWMTCGLAQAQVGDVIIAAGGGLNANVNYVGPATGAAFSPYAVALDAAGNLYIAAGDVFKVTPAGVISNFAGNGTSGYKGDGGPATSAEVSTPNALAVDPSGNVYIADTTNNVVRKVATDGTITTIAGNGGSGYAGDGGPALGAAFSYIQGIAADRAGNVYIADVYNNRIRKVDAKGIITSFAGNGQYGYSGDGGPASASALHAPAGVSVDAAGNVYIADTGNGAIRKVNSTGIITTVVGNGSNTFSGDGGTATAATLAYPEAVAIDNAGNLYISDSGNFRVRRVTPSGFIDTLAGNGQQYASNLGGPALSAGIGSTFGIACDATGNVYMASPIGAIVMEVQMPTSLPISGSVTASGPLSAQTLAATFTPPTSELNASGSEFIAAILPNQQIYLLGAKGWAPYKLGQPTAYTSGPLAALSLNLVSGLDLSSLVGTQVLMGYGRGNDAATSFTNLLSNHLYLSVYTIH